MADWDERAEALALKKEILAIRDDLNKHHRNVNISRVTGSSVAIATGVPAAACAIAVPFTLGVTLIPAIVLGIVAAVGGGVSVGASVTEIFIKRHNVKEVQARWETFRQNFLARHEEIAELEEILQKLNTQTTSNRADNPRFGGATSAGIRVTRPLLSVIFFPLDIFDLVTSALRLYRGALSPASEALTQLIEFLDTVADGSFSDLLDNDRDIALRFDDFLYSGNDSCNNLDDGREHNNDNENNDENDPLILDSDDFLRRVRSFDSSLLVLKDSKQFTTEEK